MITINSVSSATKRVSGVATVIDTGHACIGSVAWESPYIVFQLSPTQTLRWHSENVEAFAKAFGFPNLHSMEGRNVAIEANVRLAKRQFADGIERLQVHKMLSLVDL